MSQELVYWRSIRRQAESRIPNVYSSTFFARRNISIIDQQSRCFNLCWALSQTRGITASQHVGIIGGGISGLTCAVALAAWTNCLVSIFERDDILLKRFRRAAHRYIHPDLNQRGGADGYLAYDPHKPTCFPFMNWSGNYAPAFAEELIRKFEHYRASLSIALYPNTNVRKPSAAAGGIELAMIEPKRSAMKFDAVILATGFGDEQLDPSAATNDISYWLSGNPLSYRASPLRRDGPEKVLVSGNGDSAVIELAQLLIRDFGHENIFSFLPRNDLAPQLSARYANQIQNLFHRRVARGDDGLLPWYWHMRETHDLNQETSFFPSTGFDPGRELYSTAHKLLKGRTEDSHIGESEMAMVVQTLRDRLDWLGSIEIKSCLDSFDLSKIFSEKIRNIFRTDIRVTVTGRSPTIYSTIQAPLNWFLLRLLTHYGNVQYRQTELVKSRLVHEWIRCRFKNKPLVDTFHRVITRHGPAYAGYASDWGLRKRKTKSSGNFFASTESPLPPEIFVGKHELKTFQNQRLIHAQSRSLALDDEPYPGSPRSAAFIQRHADAALWICNGKADYAEATVLYRQLKQRRRSKDRYEIIEALLALASRNSQDKRPKRGKLQARGKIKSTG